MKQNWDWAQKKILITGGASGIGRATSDMFLKEGAAVICLDKSKSAIEQMRKSYREMEGKITFYEADVTDKGSLERLRKSIEEEFNNIDVLVNCAGVGMTGDFREARVEDWDWLLSINLMGTIYSTKIFLPLLLKSDFAHIVNLSSTLAFVCRASEAAYCSSKSAVLTFSRSIRVELAKAKIGVSAICPGIINTPIIDSTRFIGKANEESSREFIKTLFKQKGHDPNLVAKAIKRAIEKNLVVVPVGAEAYIAYIFSKILPVRALDKLFNLDLSILSRRVPAR